MLGIRQKLSLGFGGLLLISLIIGVQSIRHLTGLGQSIDIILRENYRSVIACQEMKESLERIDSGILFHFVGEETRGTELVRRNESAFETALERELSNITLPGEGEKARHLRDLFRQYQGTLHEILELPAPLEQHRDAYFGTLLPLFHQIKGTVDEILQMNQQNMTDANDRARRIAASAQQQMYVLLLVGMIVAVGFLFLTRRWILLPINRLIRSAEDITRGNLELVVRSDSRDEIGKLSEAFNEMARALRESRRSDQSKLTRIQRATEQTFNSLPDAVAIVDAGGNVEVSTETARNVFGLKPHTKIRDLRQSWIGELYAAALKGNRRGMYEAERRVFQHFVDGVEHYFRPGAIPILDNEKQPAGVVIVLQDVTLEREQEELKRGIISTVSHQLKSPLTSIRMAVHLLLEEKVGSLTPKQAELLIAAREESDKLHRILDNLLDISRIESGKVPMDFRRVSPDSMILESLEPFQADFKDRGVALEAVSSHDLPEAWADPTRMNHVFANLLSNALRHTPSGGKVTVRTRADEQWIYFSVSDTGGGIPPEHLGSVFEKFFRVPDKGTESPHRVPGQAGAGLGSASPDRGPGQAGAGLGLAIVKEIVEAHGGTIAVESKPGKGSTFTFTLRRADRVTQ
jgi:signal transduction histidine kinase